MAEVWATKSGQWSDTTVWNTSSLPAIVDDVFANTFTVTISSINPVVQSIRTTARTGGTAGGSFVITNNVSLTANVLAGTTVCLVLNETSPSFATITGNVSGSLTSNNAHGVSNTSNGTLNIFGEIRGGNALNSAYGANNTTGILNISGNVIAGNNTNCYGVFNSTGTVNLTGNIFANGLGTNVSGGIFNQAGGTINILGNILGASVGTLGNVGIINSGTISLTGIVAAGNNGNAHGITNSGSNAVVNIVGSAISGGGGTSGSQGILNSGGNALVTITGSASGGSSSTTNINAGILNNGTNSVVRMIGNVFGGGPTNGTNHGVSNSASTSTVFITGNVFGGIGSNLVGLTNSGAGSVFIEGTAFGGIGANAISNSSTGLVYVTKVVGNAFGLGSVGITTGTFGIASGQNSRSYIEQAEFGIRGQTPVSGPVYIIPSNRNTLVGYTTALGNTVTFYNSLSVDGLLPPASSVQLGTVYNVGNSIGTMAVPSASAVEFGVPVDNTVGVAALTPQTVWGYSRLSATDVGSMGDRLRNAATVQSVGSQIASFNL